MQGPYKDSKERILVFKSNLHLIIFDPEGFEQPMEDSDGDSNKGDGEEEKKEEDPLDGDFSGNQKKDKEGIVDKEGETEGGSHLHKKGAIKVGVKIKKLSKECWFSLKKILGNKER